MFIKLFFIEKILYLVRAEPQKFFMYVRAIPLAIFSCTDYPVITIIDFPCHLLFSAFMLHGKALKVIPINESLHWPLHGLFKLIRFLYT